MGDRPAEDRTGPVAMVKLGCGFSGKPGKGAGGQDGVATDSVPLISPLDVSQLQPPFADQVRDLLSLPGEQTGPRVTQCGCIRGWASAPCRRPAVSARAPGPPQLCCGPGGAGADRHPLPSGRTQAGLGTRVPEARTKGSETPPGGHGPGVTGWATRQPRAALRTPAATLGRAPVDARAEPWALAEGRTGGRPVCRLGC
ncbi:PREDICTED: neuron-specific vesicular protein calcyon [Condylura cristata]|uniref:neuron-specific vesicular protein calcyon n=1 Tax=Condylura cristata TaxID=143302 RepID=UPI000642F5CE|nr:PREDICTED: neuron-specific vesicular protein calcyon [Condylura cristata]